MLLEFRLITNKSNSDSAVLGLFQKINFKTSNLEWK